MTKTTLGKILRILCLVIAVIGVVQARAGQASGGAQKAGNQVTQDAVNVAFNSVISEIQQAKKAGNTEAAHRAIWENPVPYILLISDPQGQLLANFRAQVQEWRNDVQVESPTSSGGTTSLVSKGSVPSLLGLAVENGALTQTTSGTSVTFRTNPTGVINALQKHGYAESGPASYTDPAIEFVRKFSAAITFNTGSTNNTSSTSSTAQGNQAGTFTGSAQQVSGFEFRYDIINHRDPRDPKYTEKWNTLRQGLLSKVAISLHDFYQKVQGIKPSDAAQAQKFSDWRERAQKQIDDTTDVNSVNAAVLEVAKDFVNTFGDDKAVKDAATAAASATVAFLDASDSIKNGISKSPIVTFDYTDTRQGTMATTISMAAADASTATPGVKPPDLSNFKLIIAGGTVGGATLTGNASLTLFNSNPQAPATGRVRDFQLSGQVDIPLREIQSIGVPTLTFSGLFLALRQQPLGMPIQVNGVNEDLKGNIGFAQAKISFPVKKGSGVNVPLSFTYASRTELNKEHDVRGSIGVTFDLDTVFASLKP